MGLLGFLVLALVSFVGGINAEVRPILICVGLNSSTNLDGRNWVGDSVSGGNFTLSSPGIVASTEAMDSFYRNARIFNMTSHYKFNISSGNYLVRLHFHPLRFGDFNANESAFDVRANNLRLLSKLNVSGELSRRSNSTVKEYFLRVESNELRIEFSPNSGSFAFVNAIEIVPVLNQLFLDSVTRVGSDPLSLIHRGMETMYRLDVGVSQKETNQDSELWRLWESDEKFMFNLNAANPVHNTSMISYAARDNSSVAPLVLYETARAMTDTQVSGSKFNMSWKFDVDPNFDYLVRLHFCDLLSESENQRVFRIYINNKTAAENYDVFHRGGGKNKAYHEDYVDTVPMQTDTLWVQLGSNPSASSDAILNGLEIFKLSKNGNLASVSEKIDAGGVEFQSKKHKSMFLWKAIVAAAVAAVTISVVCAVGVRLLIQRRKKMTPTKDDPPVKDSPRVWRPLFLHGTMPSTANAQTLKPPLNTNGSMGTPRMGRTFTLAEIRTATNNFDESLIIGTGGFGNVYKGEIKERTLVAVKRGNPQSDQGMAEFETEIEMLSKLRHRHLVSLVGYCDEQNEMILVYEYMANGTLRSHLFGSDLPPLTWKQRLEACIGAARGLHYLHTGAERGIIHRDVKTTNILLDENFVAKMSDFGISKTGPELDHTHVSTAVKGSFGYLDPEYFRRQQLTQKSDVYSFGVVLFEVVCARPVINPTLPKDEINLAEWALRWQRQKSLATIMDPRLEGNYSIESLKKFGEIAEKCLADDGRNRPTIAEVLWHLEYVLQLHEAYMQGGGVDSFAMSELRVAALSPPSLPFIKEGEEEASPEPRRSSIGPSFYLDPEGLIVGEH